MKSSYETPTLGRLFSKDQISKIEKMKDAVFVIDSCISKTTTVDGQSITRNENIPAAFFYSKEAHPDSGSHYFALRYIDLGGPDLTLVVCDGSCIEDQIIVGAVANDGEIIHSRYRHDYQTSADGSVTIDGGREYLRGGYIRLVRYKINKGVVTWEPFIDGL